MDTTRRQSRLVGILGLVVLAAPLVARAETPAPRPIDKYHHAQPFIDDPFAISEDGTRVAYVTTDGATKSSVHITTIGDTASAKEFPWPTYTAEHVFFLDNDRVLAIDRNPATGFARGEVFGPKGAAKEKFGPATDITVTDVAGTPAIVTYMKTSGAKGDTHTLTAYRRDTLKQLGKKVFAEGADGRVKLASGLYKPSYFEDGYAEMVARKEGAYDKAKDIRRPDLEAHLEVFPDKVQLEREIGDVVKFEQFVKVRKPYAADRSFVRYAEDVRVYQLVDQDDVTSEVKWAQPIHKYDYKTLAYQPSGRDGLTVGIKVDPQNPDAVKAQKSVEDWLELYHLDVKTRALTELVRIDGQKRGTGWALGGNRVAILRKHKGFGRGGADLEVFEFGEKKAAPVEKAPAKVEEKAAAKAEDKGEAKAKAPEVKKGDKPASKK